MGLRPHRDQSALYEPRSLLLHQRLELVTLSGAEIEGLLHEQGLVDEVGLWGDQGQRDPVAREVIQRQQRLEPRDASADDDHVGPGVALILVHRRHRPRLRMGQRYRPHA